MTINNLKLKKQNQVAWIQINRPAKLNALNNATLNELHHIFSELREDNSIHVIVLTGSGEKAFVAGADISEFASFDSNQARELSERGQSRVFTFIEEMNKPVIAAINGYALGGGLELALSCHIRIASSNAKMGLPEVSLGVIPGYGGTQRLAHIIGKGRAMELIIGAQMIDASQALDYGLVTQVVSQQDLVSTVSKLSKKILNNSPFAISQAITSINSAYDESSNGFNTEIDAFSTCFSSQDFKEGTQAFLGKRKANFTGG